MIWDNVEVKAFLTGQIFDSNALINDTGGFGGRPFYNEPVAASVPGVYKSNVGTSKELMKNILRSSEFLGISRAITNDLLHGYHFEPISEKSVRGRPKDGSEKITKAEVFSKKNMLMKQLEEFYFDMIGTGDGYLWKGKPRPADADILKTLQKYKGFENVEIKTNMVVFPHGTELKVSEFYDEDSRDMALLHVAATTMEPVFNINEVIYFKQAVGSATVAAGNDPTGNTELGVNVNTSGLIERKWAAKDIIHGKFMSVDGKVWGFSPTQALLPVITTLAMIKDYTGHFFDNNGVLNKLFIFKKAHPNHPSVKALEKILVMQKKSMNKQRNLILTSEVDVQDLNRFDKDMEFRQLATYYTGLIALAFNMPMDRIQSIVVDQSPKGGDINDSAYWRSISKGQKYLADLLNGQFFNEAFGVDIVFENPFIQDKIRKIQVEAQRWGVATTMLQNGASKEYVMDFLEVPHKYRKDFDLDKAEKLQKEQMNQNPKSPDNTTNPNMRNKKAQEQASKVEKTKLKNEGF